MTVATKTDLPLLGAHVSTAGGVEQAPARGAQRRVNVIQIFTKPIHRWAEPEITRERARAFRDQRSRHAIRIAGSHDSYLINLASPDPALRQRSIDSFRSETERCRILELDFLVTHPGNATDGDRAAALERNASAIATVLSESSSPTRVLLEGTAGQGTALGASFDELAELIETIRARYDGDIGVCLDTAHLFAAGYDLVGDYEGVMAELDRILGLHRVGLFHLNDSRATFGSRVDRHEHVGEGYLGAEPFRRILRDPRFEDVPKVIETPKDDDALRADRRNLQRLRRYAASGV